MGILDIFGGGKGPDKALKLKPKVTQKYGDALTRQKAIEQVAQLRIPEAVSVLMARYTLTVDPHSTDADEKEHVFELVKGYGDMAIAPLKAFLAQSEQGISWALRLLESLLSPEDYVSTLLAELERLGGTYTRTHEKKEVLLAAVRGKQDARIAPVVLPYLEDPADDVKVSALRLLGELKYAPARESILRLLTEADSGPRVKSAALEALAAGEFNVEDHRAQVQSALVAPYTLDKAGVVRAQA